MKSDSQIQQDVIEELRWSPNVTHTNIGVSVKNGIVTLSGSVPSYAEKAEAESAALRVAGVKAIVEKTEVRLPSDLERKDEDIARAALNVLKWHVQVPDNDIKVDVENGRVRLSGEVEWSFQKEAAFSAVKSIIGVSSVANAITIKPRVSPANVKENIEQALKRAAEREAKRINVDVQGRKVILTGKVHSLAELRDARGAAWGAPGVTEVESNLQVAG